MDEVKTEKDCDMHEVKTEKEDDEESERINFKIKEEPELLIETTEFGYEEGKNGENMKVEDKGNYFVTVLRDAAPPFNAEADLQCASPNGSLGDADEKKLKKLLKYFNMECVFGFLKAAQVTYRSLQYMQREDIKEAIPPLGLRMEFREKLFKWKKKKFGIDDETMSGLSKVGDWLNNVGPPISSSADSPTNLSACGKFFNKDLTALLNQTQRGKTITEYFKQKQNLTVAYKNELINIIVEEVICNNTILKQQDFYILLQEICSAFPSETNCQEYYFIPRKGKSNPSGKLYDKYKNKRYKKLKLDDSVREIQDIGNTSSAQHVQIAEIDESICAALKASLSSDSADWAGVCDMWKKTYNMRQRELREMESNKFLRSWPTLSDARAPELIKIDFDIMHPLKGHLLYAKWATFKEKIQQFYETHIHNDYCRQLYSKAKSLANTKYDQDDLKFEFTNDESNQPESTESESLNGSDRFEEPTDSEYATESEEQDSDEDFELEELDDGNESPRARKHLSKYKNRRGVYKELIVRLCQFCGIEFNKELAWKTHMDTEHHFSEQLTTAFEQMHASTSRCKICKTKLPCDSKYMKQQHLLKHQPYKAFLKCQLCEDVKHDNLGAIRAHIEDQHNAEIEQRTIKAIQRSKRLKNGCIYCGKLLYKVRALGSHYLANHKELDDEKIAFVCPSCGEEFAKEPLWSRHCAEVHHFNEPINLSMILVESYAASSRDKFQCLKCCATLQRHILAHASTHMPHKMYKCRYCSELFENKQQIRGHLCAQLEDAIALKLPLINHAEIANLQRETNLSNLLFICPICGREFDKQAVWKSHLTVEHELDKPENLNISGLNYKNHMKCNLCEQTWEKANRNVHLYHAFTHMPFKVKKCKMCQYESDGIKTNPCHCLRQLKPIHKPVANSTILCSKCKTPFKSGYQLKCHCCAEHNTRLLEDLHFAVAPEENYECTKCESQHKFCANTYRQMCAHAKQHGNSIVYKCKHCSKSIERFSHFHRHEAVCPAQLTHIPAEFFEKYVKHLCPACGQQNASVEMLRDHLKTEHEFTNLKNLNVVEVPLADSKLTGHKCTVCEHVFEIKFLKIFQNHAFSHMPFQPYNCSLCNEGFKSQVEMMSHLKLLHGIESDENPPLKGGFNPAVVFHCPVCDLVQKSRTAFTEHVNETHKLNTLEGLALKKVCHAVKDGECYECLDCGVKLNSNSRVRFEHRLTHLPHKPYECGFCSNRFRHQNSVNRHVESCKKNYGHFECTVCPEIFDKRVNLEQHLKSHDLEDPLACKICRLKFVNANVLRSHLKALHPTTTFACSICNKQFMQAQGLRRHWASLHPGIAFVKKVKDKIAKIGNKKTVKRRLHASKVAEACKSVESLTESDEVCQVAKSESKQIKVENPF